MAVPRRSAARDAPCNRAGGPGPTGRWRAHRGAAVAGSTRRRFGVRFRPAFQHRLVALAQGRVVIPDRLHPGGALRGTTPIRGPARLAPGPGQGAQPARQASAQAVAPRDPWGRDAPGQAPSIPPICGIGPLNPCKLCKTALAAPAGSPRSILFQVRAGRTRPIRGRAWVSAGTATRFITPSPSQIFDGSTNRPHLVHSAFIDKK